MTEKQLEKRASEILEGDGYVVWFPLKTAYMRKDIFGVFDLIAQYRGLTRFVQLTTSKHASERRRKIQAWLGQYWEQLRGGQYELWAYTGNEDHEWTREVIGRRTDV